MKLASFHVEGRDRVGILAGNGELADIADVLRSARCEIHPRLQT